MTKKQQKNETELETAPEVAEETVAAPVEKFYATLDEKGRPNGFYSSFIHSTIPDGAVEITSEQHLEFVTNPNRRALVNDAIVAYEEPAPKETWENVRRKRASLLSLSDWTQLKDSPLSDSQQAAWAKYRQDLRDLPKAYKNAETVEWPKQPE